MQLRYESRDSTDYHFLMVVGVDLDVNGRRCLARR